MQMVKSVTNFFFVYKKVNRSERDATDEKKVIEIILLAGQDTSRHVTRTFIATHRKRETHDTVKNLSINSKGQVLLSMQAGLEDQRREQMKTLQHSC